MKKIILIVTVFFLAGNVFGQQTNERVIDELNKIYSNLEYNTIAFEDLKNKWFLNDPGLIRELYNKFAVKNAFRTLEGEKASIEYIMDKSEAVFEGDVVVDMRKRYYDDEIEYFAFISSSEIDKINPTPLFEPIIDGFYLKEVIGPNLYQKLQNKTYYYSSYTKDVFQTESGYFFDINLSLLEPEVMFWSTTSSKRNKYTLALAGQWGLDLIAYPGWFFSSYIAGGKMTYYEAIGDDPSEYTYKLFLGHTFAVGDPYPSTLPDENFVRTGKAVFARVSGDVGKFIFDDFDQLYLTLEGLGTYGDYKAREIDYPFNKPFWAIKNYFAGSLIKKELFNLFDFGMFEAGVALATHDVNHFELVRSVSDPVDLYDTPERTLGFFDRFQHYATAIVGVENKGELIQHHIQGQLTYNAFSEYFYAGVKAKIMLSNTFGFDVRFYTGIGEFIDRYDYRTDTYLVFSPIIRINY